MGNEPWTVLPLLRSLHHTRVACDSARPVPTMPGERHNNGNNLLKALGALALASVTAASNMPSWGSCASAPIVNPAAAAAAPGRNRWVSRALAVRGGADEPADAESAAGGAESIPGVLSEVQIVMSSFKDIVGENLLEVDNAKKGTTKEVRR